MEAEQAKKEMLIDQDEGEKRFAELLRQYGADGMIFYKRAEAWEALDNKENALADFRKAEALFPMAAWKANARAGMQRNNR